MCNIKNIIKSKAFKTVLVVGATVFCGAALAAATGSAAPSYGVQKLAYNVAQSIGNIGSLILGAFYVIGVGFMCAGLMKFYHMKQNPTQITLGQPLTLLGIGAAMLFTPTLTSYFGQTLLASSDVKADASGYTGDNAPPIGN